jgi:hypothetical protein
MRWLLFLAAASAMAPNQADMARAIMSYMNVSTWAAVIDAPLNHQYSFTDVTNQKTYIDAKRFAGRPHSLINTLLHECAHLNGALHNDGIFTMQYHLTVDPMGHVVDDGYLLAAVPGINVDQHLTRPTSRPVGHSPKS